MLVVIRVLLSPEPPCAQHKFSSPLDPGAHGALQSLLYSSAPAHEPGAPLSPLFSSALVCPLVCGAVRAVGVQ